MLAQPTRGTDSVYQGGRGFETSFDRNTALPLHSRRARTASGPAAGTNAKPCPGNRPHARSSIRCATVFRTTSIGTLPLVRARRSRQDRRARSGRSAQRTRRRVSDLLFNRTELRGSMARLASARYRLCPLDPVGDRVPASQSPARRFGALPPRPILDVPRSCLPGLSRSNRARGCLHLLLVSAPTTATGPGVESAGQALSVSAAQPLAAGSRMDTLDLSDRGRLVAARGRPGCPLLPFVRSL